MTCSKCECLVRVKNKLGYNLYYCGYKKYGVLKALCGLYINNEEYRKDNETCKYYKAEKKGRKEMTDKERAEEYAKEKIKDMKVGNFKLLEIAHLSNGADVYNPKVEHLLKDRIKQAYVDGIAEGRKEVTYMKAEEYDKYLDACRKNRELEKENADLQQRLDWAQGFLDKDVEYDELSKALKENKELKAQIEEQKAHCKAVDEVNEKMKCCGNCGHNGSDSEIGENGDYTDYTCIQCNDFSTKENPYPNWELAE